MKGKINIYKHVLVPKHIKISEKDKKKLLDKYKIRKDELPRISGKDPAVIDLKLKPGDVIKVLRKSQSAKMTVFYRAVV